MKNLSSLLERLVGALHADEILKASVREAVKECIGGDISLADITVKDGMLTVRASAIMKNELRLKEDRVLTCVFEKSGKRLYRINYA